MAPDEAKQTVPFRLSPAFLDQYRDRPAPFGFNGLGELVYRRTYSRPKPDGSYEDWYETVDRVVTGTYTMQKRWIEQHQLGWNARKAQKSAQEMYARIFDMKFLPPGRGLWAMGSALTEERGVFAALNNCAFVSTEALKDDPSRPFTFLMDASMLGVGVGFDTRGAGSINVREPRVAKSARPCLIDDSRGGWVDSVRLLLDSYLKPSATAVEFDYSQIRAAGEPIRGFGGVSSGPEALQSLHRDLRQVLTAHIGSTLSVTGIVDIMNLIGRCVVAGNVRQTAEIAFGAHDSDEYLDLKNYHVNPHRAAYGWTSNNSIVAPLGMEYDAVCQRIQSNGEPGLAWLENMRAFGRMRDPANHKDSRACGGNPCLEQTLESYELCCLVETFPNNHVDLEDYCRTLKFAYLYAKTVTLGRTHWPESNRVMLRNRRIGTSMSGIAQFIASRGLHQLQQWCDQGYAAIQAYDQAYSDWFAVPRSIKTTSIKPSGTVSLLAGATPGMHYPESEYYIRRVRLSRHSELLAPLQAAGYTTEAAVDDPDNTMVVEFPVHAGEGVRTNKDLSMWEQLSLAAFLQRYWSDNQVSCTVTFDPDREADQLVHALEYFQYQLKGVSFLPRSPLGAYKQLPYEAIDKATFQQRLSQLRPVQFRSLALHDRTPEKFCDGPSCVV